MSIVRAPFTPEQVAALKAWQNNLFFHPLTCAGGNNGEPCPGDPMGGVELDPTPNGLECAECGRLQTWAPAMCCEPPSLTGSPSPRVEPVERPVGHPLSRRGNNDGGGR